MQHHACSQSVCLSFGLMPTLLRNEKLESSNVVSKVACDTWNWKLLCR